MESADVCTVEMSAVGGDVCLVFHHRQDSRISEKEDGRLILGFNIKDHLNH